MCMFIIVVVVRDGLGLIVAVIIVLLFFILDCRKYRPVCSCLGRNS